MITKKRIIFISVMIILVVIASLYATYALNISITESDTTDYDKSLTFDIYDDTIRQISVSQGKTKTFNLNIKNPYADSIQYGIAYSLVSPTTLPEGVIVAQSSKSKVSTVGLIETNDTISVSIIVVNESTEDITLSFAIINGFKNGGELIVTEGQTLVTDIYEVGTPLADITLEKLGLTEEVQDLTPDFSKKAPQTLSYKEVTASSNLSISVSDTSYYVTYASSYTFDTVNGTFTLVNPNIATYASIYSSLAGMYISSISSSSTMSNYAELDTIYLVKSASSVEYTRDNITYTSDSMDTSECGIFESEDDFGTSYYFRGNVTNNYVSFAGFYWRIVRLNGDGTLRIIYDGLRAHANGEIYYEEDRTVFESDYNIGTDDNAYVGYMYGKYKGQTYAITHENVNNSLIKSELEHWYKDNILITGNSKYIADTIYCNDRSIYSGTGIKKEATTYMAYYRVINYNPSLKCSNINDRFTVSAEIGNGDLTYPVGLPTIDEVAMAGALYFEDYLTDKPKFNEDFYLCSSATIATMSPARFTSTSGFIVLTFNGGLRAYNTTAGIYVKPIVSLRQDLTYTGTGTMTDPFVPVLN